jgi:hypothetical protein
MLCSTPNCKNESLAQEASDVMKEYAEALREYRKGI